MKTLVEDIRTAVTEAQENNMYVTEMSEPILGYDGMNKEDEYKLFRAIAQRIEDEYMPLPKDADGVPIKLGDEVYILGDSRKFIVTRFNIKADKTIVSLNFKEGGSKSELLKWPSEIYHGEPDTLERIEADAIKADAEYWGCVGVTTCKNCPALVNGESPDERYGVEGSCQSAMMLDLLQRQRKALERMAGYSTV